jgi:hypothetical protein
MDGPLYSRPALIGDAIYLATSRRLYLIAANRRSSDEPQVKGTVRR